MVVGGGGGFMRRRKPHHHQLSPPLDSVPADDDITLFPGKKHVCSLLRSTLIALEPSWYYHHYYIRLY